MSTTLRLREWRQFHGLTQRELAQKAGLAVTTINALEAGKRQPNWQTLRKMAAAYGVVPANLAHDPFREPLMAGRSTPEEQEAWVYAHMPDADDPGAAGVALADVVLRAFLDGDPIARDILANAVRAEGVRVVRAGRLA